MKHFFIFFTLLLTLLLPLPSCHKNFVPLKEGAFETGKYRNVFLEAGHSQKEIDEKLESVFNEVDRKSVV